LRSYPAEVGLLRAGSASAQSMGQPTREYDVFDKYATQKIHTTPRPGLRWRVRRSSSLRMSSASAVHRRLVLRSSLDPRRDPRVRQNRVNLHESDPSLIHLRRAQTSESKPSSQCHSTRSRRGVYRVQSCPRFLYFLRLGCIAEGVTESR